MHLKTFEGYATICEERFKLQVLNVISETCAKVALTQGINLDPMGTPRLGHLRPLMHFTHNVTQSQWEYPREPDSFSQSCGNPWACPWGR